MMFVKLVKFKRFVPVLFFFSLMMTLYNISKSSYSSVTMRHVSFKNKTRSKEFGLKEMPTSFEDNPKSKLVSTDGMLLRKSILSNETFLNKLTTALREAEKEMMYILIWEPPFYTMNHSADPRFNVCGACRVTYNKNMIRNKDTKAVVFHYFETNIKKMPLPSLRRPDQYYVWWAMESPTTMAEIHYRHRALKDFNNVFNLTMSHRRDSDVYSPYGHHGGPENYLLSENANEKIAHILESKKHLALWLVSNCQMSSGAKKRMNFVQSLLDAGLNLHRRGKCFPENGIVKDKELIRDYKFYLAFENSYHCTDYITEKIVDNSFRFDAVPVVWGAKKFHYEAFVPLKSFIYAEDFETPEKLVNYLNYLDKNHTAYREYFAWRTRAPSEIPQYGRERNRCQLCRIMHGVNIDNIYHPHYDELRSYIPTLGYPSKPRTVSSVYDWFYENESPECASKS